MKYFLIVFFIFNATIVCFSYFDQDREVQDNSSPLCQALAEEEVPSILGTWNITAESGLHLIFYKGMDDDWSESGQKKYFVWMYIEGEKGGEISNREIQFCKIPPLDYVYLVKEQAYFHYYREGDALFLSQLESEPVVRHFFDFVEFTAGSVNYSGPSVSFGENKSSAPF